ncbi:hypothetical protein GCM10007920_02300 [Ciceribacter naphthalenivorans]|uniref:Uncharacterized protein n=2 Tax=Alphaproteobacteria TaxID=28211 RepID=A0A512HCH5_9HYPH|nr:hypothetical protein RNA01_00910 [Ciceribacter naphthalenivorans]GLR20446.1 hypothetical protein GCM10007920_02300 [Ciceribacter naphthalenivorans]GLT03302.1 hypothetical protein GCM10007926_02300 [Sphingomonas psychrolutea]
MDAVSAFADVEYPGDVHCRNAFRRGNGFGEVPIAYKIYRLGERYAAAVKFMNWNKGISDAISGRTFPIGFSEEDGSDSMDQQFRAKQAAGIHLVGKKQSGLAAGMASRD